MADKLKSTRSLNTRGANLEGLNDENYAQLSGAHSYCAKEAEALGIDVQIGRFTNDNGDEIYYVHSSTLQELDAMVFASAEAKVQA